MQPYWIRISEARLLRIGFLDPSRKTMAPMMTPLSVQFTLEQQAWLDQLTSKPRKRQGLDGQR